MDTEKKLDLGLKDVYQLLISDCRYGYTRNNHLMPSSAWDRVKELIDRMYEKDEEWARRTLSQICEECITDELAMRFYDGYDDEMGNRAQAIAFVRWCMDWIHSHGDADYKPYCWDLFEYNLEQGNLPRYRVYELVNDSKIELTKEPVGYEESRNLVFASENLDSEGRATYRKQVLRGEITSKDYLPYEKAPVRYEFLSPTKRVYLIEHI